MFARQSFSTEPVRFKLLWINKELGLWGFNWNNNVLTIYVDDDRSSEYTVFDQPCVECWDEECDSMAEQNSIRIATLNTMKEIFDDYVQYQESTDSREDKEAMTKAIQSLKWVSDQNELQILIDIWMYYDPTDYAGISEIFSLA